MQHAMYENVTNCMTLCKSITKREMPTYLTFTNSQNTTPQGNKEKEKKTQQKYRSEKTS
jgi:hypothetical protein